MYPTRKQNRLPHYDYSQTGYYFITICSRDRAQIFWNAESPLVGATCGRPSLSEIGCCVERELLLLDDRYSTVRLDKYVIMPNHLHCILRILEVPVKNGGRPQVAPTISRIVQQLKGVITKQMKGSIWQKSFHDHIIRNEEEYLRIWSYIDTNPNKWREDCYYV